MSPRRPGGIATTALCFVMATLAWGTVFYGHSVYMEALTRTHGWSTGLVSSAILVFWLASLPGTLFVGVLVDRLGPPIVVAIGGICVGGGLIGLSGVERPWQMFAIYAALGFGYPALSAAAIGATLVPWFERGFAVALGIALTGASVGGAVIPVLLVKGSGAYGFSTTLMWAGGLVIAIVACIVVLLALLGRPRIASPEASGDAAFSMAATLREPVFWKIAIAAAFGLAGQVGFLAHQVPMMTVLVDPVTASLTVTVVAVASALGRLLVGVFCQFLETRVVAAASYFIYGSGVAILALTDTVTWSFIGCAVAGLFVGAVVMLPPLLVRETFGAHAYGRAYAMVNVTMYVMAALSPFGVGLIRDLTESYGPALWVLVAVEAIAVLVILSPIGRARA